MAGLAMACVDEDLPSLEPLPTKMDDEQRETLRLACKACVDEDLASLEQLVPKLNLVQKLKLFGVAVGSGRVTVEGEDAAQGSDRPPCSRVLKWMQQHRFLAEMKGANWAWVMMDYAYAAVAAYGHALGSVPADAWELLLGLASPPLLQWLFEAAVCSQQAWSDMLQETKTLQTIMWARKAGLAFDVDAAVLRVPSRGIPLMLWARAAGCSDATLVALFRDIKMYQWGQVTWTAEHFELLKRLFCCGHLSAEHRLWWPALCTCRDVQQLQWGRTADVGATDAWMEVADRAALRGDTEVVELLWRCSCPVAYEHAMARNNQRDALAWLYESKGFAGTLECLERGKLIGLEDGLDDATFMVIWRQSRRKPEARRASLSEIGSKRLNGIRKRRRACLQALREMCLPSELTEQIVSLSERGQVTGPWV